MKITTRTEGPSTDSQIRQVFEAHKDMLAFTSTGSLIAEIRLEIDEPGDLARYRKLVEALKKIQGE